MSILGNFRVLATHHACNTDALCRVCDQQHIFAHDPFLAVEGGYFLSLNSIANDYMSVCNAGKIEGMHGMTIFNQYIIGNIYDIVDGTESDKLQPELHPLWRGLDLEICDHPGAISGAEYWVSYGNGCIILRASLSLYRFYLRLDKLLPERACSLTADTDDALTIRTVRSEFDIEYHVIETESFLNALSVRMRFMEYKNAVVACSVILHIVYTQFGAAAEHAIAHLAAHLCRLYLHSVCKGRTVKCNGNLASNGYIGRIGHYPEGFIPADIHRADTKAFRIRMLLNFIDRANENILNIGHFGNHIRNLKAPKKHTPDEFLVGHIIVYIIFKPLKR